MGAGSQEELQCSLEIKEFEAKKLFNKYLLRVYLKKKSNDVGADL